MLIETVSGNAAQERSSPISSIDLTKSAAFLQSDFKTKWYAQLAADYLNAFSREGLINLSSATSIFDFGSGSGGSAITLAQLAYLNGGIVTAAEKDEDKAKRLANLGIIPQDRVTHEDGVVVLNSAPSDKRYNLVAAFLLGPDYDGTLINKLIPAAEHACAPGGYFVVTSDCLTMPPVYEEFIDRNLAFTPITTCGDHNDPEHSGLITSFKKSNSRQYQPFSY